MLQQFYDAFRASLFRLIFLFFCLMACPVFAASSSEQDAKLLGWHEGVGTCGGYFLNPPFLTDYNTLHLEHPEQPMGANLVKSEKGFNLSEGVETADNVTFLLPSQQLTAGHVVIQGTSGQQLKAVHLSKGLSLAEPGRLLKADSGDYNFVDDQGSLKNILYRFENPVRATPNADNHAGQSAWGRAGEFKQDRKKVYDLTDATYSTCPWHNEVWKLKAHHIHVNNETQEVTVKKAMLYIKGIPVFYFPRYSFSINNARKTGFLSPTVQYSSINGLYFMQPFYWNLAPNYDATLSPEFYSLRGPAFGGLFRYLTPSSSGSLTTDYIFNDRAFTSFRNNAPLQYVNAIPDELSDLKNDSSHRGVLSFKDESAMGNKWTASTDLNWVSDDYYLENMANGLQLNPYGLPNQVLQQGQLHYYDRDWSFSLLGQRYQTLHPIDLAATANQYMRLPELDLSARSPEKVLGFNYGADMQYVNFLKARNPGEVISPVGGSRFHVSPMLSLPLMAPGRYITPALQLDATQYVLHHSAPGPADITRVLPITSVDSGLYFSRPTSFFGEKFTQTLEPRAFYLFVPYRNQAAFPLFDTFSQVLNYDQMFLTNRFTGIDRIGDANQMTLGLKTRFLDNDTGVEKLSAGIAAIAYFHNRQVSFCNANNCTPSDLAAEQVGNQQAISPIAGVLTYYINTAWSVSGNTTYVAQQHEFNSQSLNVQYMPEKNYIVNLGYQFQRGADPLPSSMGQPIDNVTNNLNRVTISGAWPLVHSWSVLGAWEYNISHSAGQQYLLGLGYDSCCWGMQLIGSRQFSQFSPSNEPQYNNSIAIQFTLKGLGSLGNNSVAQITQIIPGYQSDPQTQLSL